MPDSPPPNSNFGLGLPNEKLPPRPELTDADRKLIKDSAPLLEPARFGVKITERMYARMLSDYPDLNNVFSHSKQTTGKQAFALAASVHAYASNINDLTPILPVVERICHKHVSLSITPQMYNVVGTYLLEAIGEVLKGGNYSFDGPLKEAWVRGYWHLAYIFIGKEAELYGGAGWPGWKEFKVAEKVKESGDITSFYLKPADGSQLRPYKPGLYISVQLTVDALGYKQSRQYSLSDSPTPGSEYYRISVKREDEVSVKTSPPNGAAEAVISRHPAYISHLLHDTIQQGDSVEVAYPFGEFFIDNFTSPVVFLSAGVGLTPLLAMFNTLTTVEGKPPTRQIRWIQGMRTPRDHAFLQHIRSMAQKYPDQIKTAIFYSRLIEGDQLQNGDYKGRMNLFREDFDKGLLHLDDKESQYYICGPVAFMDGTKDKDGTKKDGIKDQLKQLGVGDDRVHSEVFVP